MAVTHMFELSGEGRHQVHMFIGQLTPLIQLFSVGGALLSIIVNERHSHPTSEHKGRRRGSRTKSATNSSSR